MKETKWFSTGFTGGGVKSVDREKHVLSGVVLLRVGEAKGHGLWIDREFIDQANFALASKSAGMKARFGHPNMCSEALGTFIGRWKNPTIDQSGAAYRGAPAASVQLRADLFLSSAASESPSGDLRAYIEAMAEKEPDMCGASIVFQRDIDAENAFVAANGGTSFASPDPANVNNFPHARLAALHAADIVDDPAATDGMFSEASSADLAAKMTEFLDLHPEVFAALSDPQIMTVIEAHSDRMAGFIAKYQAHKQQKDAAMATPETPKDPAEPRGKCPVCGADVVEPAMGDSAKCVNGHQFPEKDLKPAGEAAPVDAAASVPPIATAAQATPEPNAESLAKDARIAELEAQLADRENKLAILSKGAAPVSTPVASAAEGAKLTPWQRAQSKK